MILGKLRRSPSGTTKCGGLTSFSIVYNREKTVINDERQVVYRPPNGGIRALFSHPIVTAEEWRFRNSRFPVHPLLPMRLASRNNHHLLELALDGAIRVGS
jgi:hypothetical protein